jgi:hypothetical protein
MTPRKPPEWEVRVYGPQRAELDVDLIAHIVVLLGRQLEREANGDTDPDGSNTVNTKEEP